MNYYIKYLDPLKSIVLGASDIILEIYNTNFENTIKLKPDESPVTIADKLANKYIVNRLKLNYPDIPIISEEGDHSVYETRKNYKLYWLVDPLDGTKEFIKKNDEFTINIALIKDNIPVLGIVYVPVYKELFYGIKKFGAYKILGDKELKLEANMVNLEDSELIFLMSRSHLSSQEDGYLKTFNSPIIKNMGSSLKFLRIAEGIADVYFRFLPTMEWDTAAAQVILEEAGGTIKNILTKRDLLYNKQSLVNPGFIAMGKQI